MYVVIIIIYMPAVQYVTCVVTATIVHLMFALITVTCHIEQKESVPFMLVCLLSDPVPQQKESVPFMLVCLLYGQVTHSFTII